MGGDAGDDLYVDVQVDTDEMHGPTSPNRLWHDVDVERGM